MLIVYRQRSVRATRHTVVQYAQPGRRSQYHSTSVLDAPRSSWSLLPIRVHAYLLQRAACSRSALPPTPLPALAKCHTSRSFRRRHPTLRAASYLLQTGVPRDECLCAPPPCMHGRVMGGREARGSGRRGRWEGASQGVPLCPELCPELCLQATYRRATCRRATYPRALPLSYVQVPPPKVRAHSGGPVTTCNHR